MSPTTRKPKSRTCATALSLRFFLFWSFFFTSYGFGALGFEYSKFAVSVAQAEDADKSSAQVGNATQKKKSKNKKTRYCGEPISLNLRHESLHNVFEIISEASGKNIIADRAVFGSVTIKLSEVPWDQAFEIILSKKRLSTRVIGGIIEVVPLRGGAEPNYPSAC